MKILLEHFHLFFSAYQYLFHISRIICAKILFLPSLRKLSADNLRKDDEITLLAQIIFFLSGNLFIPVR